MKNIQVSENFHIEEKIEGMVGLYYNDQKLYYDALTYEQKEYAIDDIIKHTNYLEEKFDFITKNKIKINNFIQLINYTEKIDDTFRGIHEFKCGMSDHFEKKNISIRNKNLIMLGYNEEKFDSSFSEMWIYFKYFCYDDKNIPFYYYLCLLYTINLYLKSSNEKMTGQNDYFRYFKCIKERGETEMTNYMLFDGHFSISLVAYTKNDYIKHLNFGE